jgi:hypothetical protein
MRLFYHTNREMALITYCSAQAHGSFSIVRAVAVERLSFNPATLTVNLQGVVSGNWKEKEPLLSLDGLQVNVAGFASLARRAVILDEVDMSGPGAEGKAPQQPRGFTPQIDEPSFL